jgi:hypothetical protein
LVEQAAAASEPLVIVLGALPETECVLAATGSTSQSSPPPSPDARNRRRVFQHEPTLEETLYIWTQQPSADFADCLLSARSSAGPHEICDLRRRHSNAPTRRASDL